MRKQKKQFSVTRNFWVFNSDSLDILMNDMGISKKELLNKMEETGFSSKAQFEDVKKHWFDADENEEMGAKKIKIKISVSVEEK